MIGYTDSTGAEMGLQAKEVGWIEKRETAVYRVATIGSQNVCV